MVCCLLFGYVGFVYLLLWCVINCLVCVLVVIIVLVVVYSSNRRLFCCTVLCF